MIYLINSSQIQNATESAEFSIKNVVSEWTAGSYLFYGNVSEINVTIKNTGETILGDLSAQYKITKQGHKTIEGKSTYISNVNPGEESTQDVAGYITVDQKGIFNVEITLLNGENVLDKETTTFTVE